MGLGALFVEVFEMQADDPAFEFLEALDRVEARAHPVADIGAGAQQRAASVDGGEHGFGFPIEILRAGVVVDGHFDIVFLGEFFDDIHDLREFLHLAVGFGFGHQHFDAQALGGGKQLPAFRLVGGGFDHAHIDEFRGNPLVFHPGEDGIVFGLWQVRSVHPLEFAVFHQVDAAGDAHVFDAHRGGLVDRLVDGEFLESVGVHREFPSEFLGTGFGRGRRADHARRHRGRESQSAQLANHACRVHRVCFSDTRVIPRRMAVKEEISGGKTRWTDHHSRRWSPAIQSKWRSRETTGCACCRASAPVQISLCGMGRPARFSWSAMAA